MVERLVSLTSLTTLASLALAHVTHLGSLVVQHLLIFLLLVGGKNLVQFSGLGILDFLTLLHHGFAVELLAIVALSTHLSEADRVLSSILVVDLVDFNNLGISQLDSFVDTCGLSFGALSDSGHTHTALALTLTSLALLSVLGNY